MGLGSQPLERSIEPDYLHMVGNGHIGSLRASLTVRTVRAMPADLMNTPAFGAYVARLRENVLNMTKDHFANEFGALSRTDQSRVESGDADVPLTESRLTRTAQALTKADPQRFPEAHTEDFLTAVAATCAAAVYDQEQADESGITVGDERSAVIREHARNWDENPGVLIGARASGLDGLIIGRALMPATELGSMLVTRAPAVNAPPTAPVNAFWADEAAGNRAQFAETAILIAARQHGVATTCPSSDPISAKAIDSWPEISVGTVQRRADLRLDPLGGPMTMRAARRRAWALGATSHNVFAVACLVFLANAVAATSPDVTPMQAWLQIRADDTVRLTSRKESLQPFVKAYHATKERLPAEYLPQYESLNQMIVAAEPLLSVYLDSADEPLWDMTIRVEGNALAIDVDAGTDGGPYTPAADDLLIYEQNPAQSTLRNLVADMGVPTLELRSTSVGRTDAQAEDPMYFWCPISGLHHRYAVLYEKNSKTWTPTQLF